MSLPGDCRPGLPRVDGDWCLSSPSAAHSWPARWGTWRVRWGAASPWSTRAWELHPIRSSYWDSRWGICKPDPFALSLKGRGDLTAQIIVSTRVVVLNNFCARRLRGGSHLRFLQWFKHVWHLAHWGPFPQIRINYEGVIFLSRRQKNRDKKKWLGGIGCFVKGQAATNYS